MTTILRDATPDDVDFVAWVMLAASRSHLQRGIWEYLNDQDEEETLHFLRNAATTQGVHTFHHSLFLIAEVDGEPAAGMCAYDSATQGMDAYAAELPNIAAASNLALDDPEFARRMDVLMSGFVHEPVGPPGPRWVVENVATKPEFRRMGLVSQLLTELFARGKERGFSTTQIGVFIENERARGAYLKAGYDVVATQTSDAWMREIGSSGTELMLKPL